MIVCELNWPNIKVLINLLKAKDPQLPEEVHQMTEPMIRLPSVIIREFQVEIATKGAELKDKDAEIKQLPYLYDSCYFMPNSAYSNLIILILSRHFLLQHE